MHWAPWLLSQPSSCVRALVCGYRPSPAQMVSQAQAVAPEGLEIFTHCNYVHGRRASSHHSESSFYISFCAGGCRSMEWPNMAVLMSRQGGAESFHRRCSPLMEFLRGRTRAQRRSRGKVQVAQPVAACLDPSMPGGVPALAGNIGEGNPVAVGWAVGLGPLSRPPSSPDILGFHTPVELISLVVVFFSLQPGKQLLRTMWKEGGGKWTLQVSSHKDYPSPSCVEH